MNGEKSNPKHQAHWGSLLILLILLGGALAYLCRQGFLSHEVLFANDMSLGAMMDSSDRLPATFSGHWGNLEFLGAEIASSSPSFTAFLQTLFPPETYMRIYAPVTMLFLGLGAWLFFRESGFAPGVCVVGGLGAGLNMHYFSNACWGLGQWDISAAMIFVALAVLVSPSIQTLWIKGALTGLSIGMVVMEGFDAGAILSLYAGVFIIYYFLILPPNPVQAVPRTIMTGFVVVLFALLISSSTIYTLIGSTFTENASTGKTETDKKDHWVFLTTYSLPKMESLRILIPGLYGYRLQEFMTDTNKSSAYWGTIAEDYRVAELESGNKATRAQGVADLGIPNPDIQKILEGDETPARDQIMDSIKSQLPRRHSGSGDYAGELVCLLAFLGLFNSWRKSDSPYSKSERLTVWFWGIAALFSLLAAWGRYGWVYQFIAPLPFLRNIRNPIKFLHPMNVCLIILAGYGMEALHRCYMSSTSKSTGFQLLNVARWWKKSAGFDKKWVVGTLLVLVAAIVALMMLGSCQKDLVNHIVHGGFGDEQAAQMAAFSLHEVILFVIFFAVSVGVVIGAIAGAFSGGRAVWAWVLLGAITIFDLSRADEPWVRYFDYQQKYSMNPVIDFLRQKPFEHRVVSARRSPVQPIYDLTQVENFGGICHFWLENDYMANDIESLEMDQAPRMPDLDRNYIADFSPRSQQDLTSTARLWQLTNTRYVLADANLTPVLNQVIEPKNSFRDVMHFDLALKPGVTVPEDAGDLTAQTNDNGRIALIEYTQALPRAKLFASWQMADDSTALQQLASPNFDPAKTVLVATNTPVAQTPAPPGTDPGTVTISSYHPKDIKLTAEAKTPAVLLFNERIGDHWNVSVDHKPASILRCNYIMRGVLVPQGQHTIEFRFQPPLSWLYVSASAFAVGVLLAGYVAFTRLKPAPDSSSAPGKTAPLQNRKSS